MPLNSFNLLEDAEMKRLTKMSIFTPFGVSGTGLSKVSKLPLWQRCAALPLDFFCHLGAGSIRPAFFVWKYIYDKIPPGTQFPIIILVIPAVITFALSLAIAALLLVPRTLGTLGKALKDGAHALKDGAESVHSTCFGNS